MESWYVVPRGSQTFPPGALLYPVASTWNACLNAS